MGQIAFGRRALVLGIAALPFLARRAAAAEVTVLTSGGLTAAYRLLGPDFERATGHILRTVQGSSMGAAPDAIPQRLARREPADVLLLAADGLEALIDRGLAQPGSRVDVARSLTLPGQKRKLRPNIRDLRPEDEISYHIEIAAKLGVFCPGSDKK